MQYAINLGRMLPLMKVRLLFLDDSFVSEKRLVTGLEFVDVLKTATDVYSRIYKIAGMNWCNAGWAFHRLQ